jgi:hypothetical protein
MTADARTPQLIDRESPIAWLYVALLPLARVIANWSRG